MDIRKLQRAIVDGLEDVKAQYIVVFNTEALSPLFERVIIASGTSNRQTKALAASVRDAVKAIGEPVPRTEGEENGEWIIVDCGAAVAHIMQPAIREYYRLEEIWGAKPVALKKAAAKGLPKASEPADAPAATKAVAKKTPAAKRAAPGAAPAAAKKAAAKKTVAKKAAPAKAPARKATAKSVPAKKAPAKAAPARKAAAKKTPASTAARKSPARKAPARKPTRA